MGAGVFLRKGAGMGGLLGIRMGDKKCTPGDVAPAPCVALCEFPGTRRTRRIPSPIEDYAKHAFHAETLPHHVDQAHYWPPGGGGHTGRRAAAIDRCCSDGSASFGPVRGFAPTW